MQDAGARSGGNPPSFFAQAQAKFGVLPVEKESLIQQSGVRYGGAGDKHAGAIQGVKPIVCMRHCGVASVAYPEVHAGARPCFYGRGRVSIVADGADRADGFVRQGFGYERSKRVRIRLRVIVQQPQILGAVREGIADSDVIAACET